MSYLLRRLTALFLAALLLCSAGGVSVFAAETEQSVPACVLGTTPADMLEGGGKLVSTERGLYYIGDDGCVYQQGAYWPVVRGTVAKLNYGGGVLYYARLRENGTFDLCSCSLYSGSETLLLTGFSGTPGQLYLVDGKKLVFSRGDEIWELSLANGYCTQILKAEDLWSFVPTGCGLVYATGSLFDYTIYAGGQLLVRHAEDYYVDADSPRVVYTAGGTQYQAGLAAAFAGTAQPSLYGEEVDGSALFLAEEAEDSGETEEIQELAEPVMALPDLEQADPNDPQSPEDPEEWLALQKAQPTVIPIPRESEPVDLFRDGANRRTVSQGVQNIVRRARQMLNIQWTPKKNVLSWKNYLTYQAGVTYTGLPYCMGGNYVPWDTSLDSFVAAVNDSTSKFYTNRTSYSGYSGPYYGTDCSGFVSWTWDTGRRTNSLTSDSTRTYQVGVVKNNYQNIQIGDALSSSSHIAVVTDVTYNSDGSINYVEVSHANNTHSTYDCCNSIRYGVTQLTTGYFGSFGIYRGKLRDSTTYTHSCAVPLEGDVCALCGAGMGSGGGGGDDPRPPSEYARPGIDLSWWNGEVDWDYLAPEIEYAFLRLGYTGNGDLFAFAKDSRFEFNAAGCEAHGVPYGVYYYAGATSVEQALIEVDNVLQYLGLVDAEGNPLEGGHTPELPIIYDVEELNNILKLDNQTLAEVITAFCGALEERGFQVGIYSSAYVWDYRLTAEFPENWVRWVAQYQNSEMTAYAGAHVWQFGQGNLPGVATEADLNFWLGEMGSTEHCCGARIQLAPTCTENAGVTWTCKVCGQSGAKITAPALGHNYVDGVCVNCGETRRVSDLFTDIEAGKWYTEAVQYVVDNGLFSGRYEGYFGRIDPMDRAMMVTVLYSLAQKPDLMDDANPFSDVNEGSYYYTALLWAWQNGIISGTGENSFSPKLDVTREQVAVMLYKFLCRQEVVPGDGADLSVYPDADTVSHYAEEALAWAVEAGIISGSRQGDTVLLLPKDNASRAEVAVMFKRFSECLEELDALAQEDEPEDLRAKRIPLLLQ